MQSSISLRADISQLRSELAKVPGITEAEAQRMVIALEKNFKKAEAAAKSLTRSQTREAEKAAKAAEKAAADQARAYERSLDDIKRGSEKVFGGIVGDIEDVGKGLVSLGGTAGVAAAGVGGATLAVGALTYAAVSGAQAIHALIQSADPLIERLAEIEGAEGIPPESIAALDRYRQASLGAEVAAAELQVQVAALAADAFEPAMAALSGLIGGFRDMLPAAKAVKEEIEAVQLVTRVGVGLLSLGATEAIRYAVGFDDLTEAAREANAALVDQAIALEDVSRATSAATSFIEVQTAAMLAMTGASDSAIRLSQQMEEIDRVTAEYVATLDTSNEAERALAEAAYESAEVRKRQIAATHAEAEAKLASAEASKASAAELRDEAAAAAEVNEFLQLDAKHRLETAESNAKFEASLDAKRAAQQVETATLTQEQINQLWADAHTFKMQMIAVEVEATAAQAAAALDIAMMFGDLAMQAFEADQARHEQNLANIREERAAQVDSLQEKIDLAMEGYDEMSAAEQALADQKVAGYNAEIETARKTAKAVAKMEKEKIRESFKKQKALQIAMIWAGVPGATMALLPGVALAMGPLAAVPGAALGVAAGIAALAGGIQSGLAASAKPPEFPTGGYAMDRAGTAPRQSSADHVVVGVRPDERILSPQESRMYDGGAQPVYLMLDRRVVAEAMVSAGGTARLAPPAGRVSGRATAYGRG